MNLIILIIAGCFAGIMAGLFGVGGATIMVPLYLYYFKIQNYLPLDKQYYMAVGSSLAVIFFCSIVASINNYRQKLIEYHLLKRFMPGLMVGILVGTAVSHLLNGFILKKCFAFFLALIAIHLFFSHKKSQNTIQPISQVLFHGIAFLMGILTTLFGLAGGVILIPFFIFIGLTAQKAAATSIFFAIPISLVASLALNLTSPNLLIDWAVVIPTALTSSIFIPLGSKIGQKISSEWLKKIFAGFLFIIACEMLISG